MVQSEDTKQPIKVQAMILADHIYQDHGTGKYIIAGTFHHLNVLQFPTTFARSIGVYIAMRGVQGHNKIELEFVDLADNTVLMQMPPLEFDWADASQPVQVAVEVPPVPLPHVGKYSFRLVINGIPLAETFVLASSPDSGG